MDKLKIQFFQITIIKHIIIFSLTKLTFNKNKKTNTHKYHNSFKTHYLIIYQIVRFHIGRRGWLGRWNKQIRRSTRLICFVQMTKIESFGFGKTCGIGHIWIRWFQIGFLVGKKTGRAMIGRTIHIMRIVQFGEKIWTRSRKWGRAGTGW